MPIVKNRVDESIDVKTMKKYSKFSLNMNPNPTDIPAIAKARGDSTNVVHNRINEPIGKQLMHDPLPWFIIRVSGSCEGIK